jgi:hypothetical protein
MSTQAARASDKVMFEVYREGHYNRTYRVVYFTELGDHNREQEFNRALAGDHFLDGFLAGQTKERGKEIIAAFVDRLNDGEELSPDALRGELGDLLA